MKIIATLTNIPERVVEQVVKDSLPVSIEIRDDQVILVADNLDDFGKCVSAIMNAKN